MKWPRIETDRKVRANKVEISMGEVINRTTISEHKEKVPRKTRESFGKIGASDIIATQRLSEAS